MCWTVRVNVNSVLVANLSNMIFTDLSETTSMRGSIDIDRFTDNKGVWQDNSMYRVAYSEKDILSHIHECVLRSMRTMFATGSSFPCI